MFDEENTKTHSVFTHQMAAVFLIHSAWEQNLHVSDFSLHVSTTFCCIVAQSTEALLLIPIKFRLT